MIDRTKLTDIFFDLDHTLWDFETNSAATFKQILSEHDHPFSLGEFMEVYTPINHAYWKQYRENKISTQELRLLRLEKTFSTLGVQIHSSTLEHYSNTYIEQLSTHTHLFEGTHEVLSQLSKRYRLHIITNGFENVQQRKMHNSNIAQYFHVVLTAEKAGVKKPHPEIFRQAMSLAQTTAEQSLMVGDSWEADIEGALKLEMQAIHFNSHQEAKHHQCPMVDSVGDILNFI